MGNVWTAVDGAGRPLTVAALEAHVAADQRCRDAFVAAAQALPPQSDGQPYANADFTAPTPWVTRLTDGSLGAEHVARQTGRAALDRSSQWRDDLRKVADGVRSAAKF